MTRPFKHDWLHTQDYKYDDCKSTGIIDWCTFQSIRFNPLIHVKLFILIVVWCLYVLDCLFAYVLSRILVFNYFEPSMEENEARRTDRAHARDEEGLASEDEALSTAQSVKAAAERLKKYPWQEEGEDFLIAVDSLIAGFSDKLST